MFGFENLCKRSRNDCIFMGFFGYDPSNMVRQIEEDCTVQDTCFNTNGDSLCAYEGMWFGREVLVSYFWLNTLEGRKFEVAFFCRVEVQQVQACSHWRWIQPSGPFWWVHMDGCYNLSPLGCPSPPTKHILLSMVLHSPFYVDSAHPSHSLVV